MINRTDCSVNQYSMGAIHMYVLWQHENKHRFIQQLFSCFTIAVLMFISNYFSFVHFGKCIATFFDNWFKGKHIIDLLFLAAERLLFAVFPDIISVKKTFWGFWMPTMQTCMYLHIHLKYIDKLVLVNSIAQLHSLVFCWHLQKSKYIHI